MYWHGNVQTEDATVRSRADAGRVVILRAQACADQTQACAYFEGAVSNA
jgi:hypothetical protein